MSTILGLPYVGRDYAAEELPDEFYDRIMQALREEFGLGEESE